MRNKKKNLKQYYLSKPLPHHFIPLVLNKNINNLNFWAQQINSLWSYFFMFWYSTKYNKKETFLKIDQVLKKQNSKSAAISNFLSASEKVSVLTSTATFWFFFWLVLWKKINRKVITILLCWLFEITSNNWVAK